MMRLLVLSDSHGDIPSLKMAIEKEPEADAVIFLGDGLGDYEYCRERTNKICVAVRGNCDVYYSDYPKLLNKVFGGKSVYITHGDTEKVKFGLTMLKMRAKETGSDIVLFGHTHNPVTEYDNGIHYLNPGSVRQNSYGIVDITEGGIICFHKKIVSSY